MYIAYHIKLIRAFNEAHQTGRYMRMRELWNVRKESFGENSICPFQYLVGRNG